MKKIILGLLLGNLLIIPSVHAQIYKWTDENGKIHFSDKPVKMNNVERLKNKPAPAPALNADVDVKDKSNVAEQKKEPASDDPQQQAINKQKAIEKEKIEQERAANCKLARENLATLNSGMRIRGLNTSGEMVFLDDVAITEKKQTAEKQVSDLCSPS